MKLPLEPALRRPALPPAKAAVKRGFDLIVALILAPVILPVSAVLMVLAWRSTGKAIFAQERVGRYGEFFILYKICSMRSVDGIKTNVTTRHDPRITRFGHIIRKTKLDEFPQLVNVLRGDMSFVGPRPDVPETYAALEDTFAPVLCLRPGITGLASIVYYNEEILLSQSDDPEKYNDEVLRPAKMNLNMTYIDEQSLFKDVEIMIKTAARVFKVLK